MTQTKTLTPSTTSPSPNILEQYASLRWQIAELEAQLKEIQSEAIAAAIEIISSGQAKNGKRLVYQSDIGTINLQFRTHKPKPSDHQDLETLAEFIELEAEDAQRKNAPAIAAVSEQISRLQKELEQLQQTDEGREYLAEYRQMSEKLTTKKPVLNVKLS